MQPLHLSVEDDEQSFRTDWNARALALPIYQAVKYDFIVPASGPDYRAFRQLQRKTDACCVSTAFRKRVSLQGLPAPTPAILITMPGDPQEILKCCVSSIYAPLRLTGWGYNGEMVKFRDIGSSSQ